MPTAIITSEIAIHRITQAKAGTPVAAAMLAASEAASEAASDEAEMTNSVFKLKNALSRHWTARNAREKLTHLSVANLAIANSPAVRTEPETTVKTTLPNVTLARKFQNGAIKPKTTVITAINPEQR